MKVEFTVGTAIVRLYGSASSISKIRKTIEYVDHMVPMFDELDEVKKILPVAGAGNAVMTIRAMTEEIAKLRKQVQVQHDVKDEVEETEVETDYE